MVGVCEEETMGFIHEDETLTLTRCHSCGLSKLCGTLVGWRFVYATKPNKLLLSTIINEVNEKIHIKKIKQCTYH